MPDNKNSSSDQIHRHPSGEDVKNLIFAAQWGDIDTVEVLLDKYGQNIIEGSVHGGDTALSAAAKEGYTRLMTFLIEKGAAIDKKNHLGETPLMRAISWGKKDAAELLLQRGASLQERNNRGQTPLMVAEDHYKDGPIAAMLREWEARAAEETVKRRMETLKSRRPLKRPLKKTRPNP